MTDREMASIRKRGNKYCVIYNYTDKEGARKQKWETYKTFSEAKKRKKEVEYKQEVGEFVIPKCTTVREGSHEAGRQKGCDLYLPGGRFPQLKHIVKTDLLTLLSSYAILKQWVRFI